MRGEEAQRPGEARLEQGQRVREVGGGATAAVEQGRQRGREEGEAAWRRQWRPLLRLHCLEDRTL